MANYRVTPLFSPFNKCVLNDSKWAETHSGNFFMGVCVWQTLEFTFPRSACVALFFEDFPNNVTFISQPPSNQMSLFPTYLITVLIYGIISYQTQNLPQLKLRQSGPLPSLYEGFVVGSLFTLKEPPRGSLSHSHHKLWTKTNIPSLM